jgi:hypothetical protein
VLIVSFAIYAYHMGWKLLHEVDDEDDEVWLLYWVYVVLFLFYGL